MTIGHRRIAWLLVLVLAVPALASARRKGRLIGKVIDPEGKPVPGVTVTATCEEIPSFRVVKTTDRKGVFKLDFKRLNVVYHYRFEKPGLQTMQANQTWELEGTKTHKFTMQQAAAAPTTTPAATRPAAGGRSLNPAILAFNSGAEAFRAKDYATAQAKFEQAVSCWRNPGRAGKDRNPKAT